MPSVVKYGKYWISAGIAISGAIWLARPGDPRVMGEDIADVFEQVQEMLLVPYQYGTQIPDFYGYNIVGNAYPSNSISSEIKYQIIQNMADRIRYITTRSDTSIFWTSATFGDTSTLALSHGPYATALSSGVSVDYLNAGGWTITNKTYSYSTNSFSDAIVTSASRLWTNGCQFETINPIDKGDDYSTLALSWTNLPMANLVFGRGSATTITNASNFTTPGSAWPFPRSYSFPWEQWLGPNRGRISCGITEGVNVTITNAVIVSAPGSVSFYPARTNVPGYAALYLEDASHNKSVPFYVVYPPVNNNYLWSAAYIYAPSWGVFYGDVLIRVNTGGLIPYVDWEVITGEGLSLNVKQQNSNYVDFYFRTYQDNTTIVVKFSHQYQLSAPIYCIINAYRTAPVLTNDYFTVTSKAFNGNPVTAVASTNTMPTEHIIYSDKRITTNKLNSFAQVLTNMNRTVCIGSRSLLSCTGLVQVVQSHSLTNYLTEFLYGEGTTPSFFTGYTRNDLVDDFSTITEVSTNASSATGVGNTAEYLFSFFDQGWASVSTNDLIYDWWSDTEVEGNIHERKNNTWLGCSPSYPSLWALTNGLVKKVTIYAAMEVVKNISDSYLPWDLPTQNYYKHTSSGEYWNEGNFGVMASNLTINLPSHSVDALRTNGLHKVFPGGTAYDGNFWFTDTAIFSKIYETNNPTGPIAFDWQCPSITHADPKQRYAYFSYETAASGDRDLFREWHYRLGYRVLASRIMIVVDWDFKYLGRGFVPVTNTPEGR